MTDRVDDEVTMDIVERINALHEREILHYRISQNIYDSFSSEANKDITTILEWRKKMIHYCYQIVDYCDLSHESVIVATSYLDRFLFEKAQRPVSSRVVEARTLALRVPGVFQVVAVTCLYTAIKLTEASVLDITSMLAFTNNSFSAIQIERMESIVLEALDWYLTPPTPILFVNEICQLPGILKIRDLRNDTIFFELVSQQIDMVKMDSAWVRSTSSHIAYSTIKNALKVMCISIFQRKEIEKLMHDVLLLEKSSTETILQQIALEGDSTISPLQSIFVENSRIEIRQVTSMEHIGKYEEIDVVLQDETDLALALSTSSDESNETNDSLDSATSGTMAVDDDLLSVDLQQRLLEKLSDTLQRKNSNFSSSVKRLNHATSVASRVQSRHLRFVDYSTLL
jgi:Cyclin, N-terminal domain